jgi:hypothetical protein
MSSGPENGVMQSKRTDQRLCTEAGRKKLGRQANYEVGRSSCRQSSEIRREKSHATTILFPAKS